MGWVSSNELDCTVWGCGGYCCGGAGSWATAAGAATVWTGTGAVRLSVGSRRATSVTRFSFLWLPEALWRWVCLDWLEDEEAE